MKVIAFSPAHITGFFKICMGKNEEETGSIGGGISINRGSYAFVEPWNEIRVSKKASVTREAIKMFGNFKIKIKNELPVSQGFGMSGSSTLAASMAACYIKKLPFEIALKNAHIAEVRKKTGLGDVVASFHGGMEARIKPGIKGKIKKWDVRQKILILVAGKPIKTKKILEGKIDEINEAGEEALKNFLRIPTFDNFMAQSKFFSERSNILNEKMMKLLKKLNEIDTTAACMIGNSFFSKWSKRMKKEMRKYGRVYEASVDNYGARLIAALNPLATM